MKISCIQENLKQGLSLVSHITSKNVNLPILNNVLIEVKDGSINLSTTNLEIGINCKIRGKIESEGAFTVDAKLLTDYINLLPKERIDIELEENFLSVNCNNHSTKINGLSSVDFPLIPQLEKERPYICNADSFRKAISQVIFATAHNEARPEISGVLLKFGNKTLTAVGTDSYRLAERKVSLDNDSCSDEKNIIIPVRTLQEVARILTSYKDNIEIPENIHIYVNEGQVLFVYDVVQLVSRLVEGKYPDYEQIIPTKSETSIVTNISDLIKAVKTSSLFSKSGINDVNLEFIPSETENKVDSYIKISSMNDQIGENISTVNANITGLKNGTVLNYNYLLDGLNSIDSPEVSVELLDSSSPCVLRPAGATDIKDAYLYIIMPIRQ